MTDGKRYRKPAFDPSQPFQTAATEDSKPSFDPSQPFNTAPAESDSLDVAKNTSTPSLGPILSAFGHGAKEGWGDEPLGLSPDAIKWLSEKKIFGPEKGGYDNPFQAFNEMLAHTVVGAAQIALRTGAAALGSYQAGVAETGEPTGQDAMPATRLWRGSWAVTSPQCRKRSSDRRAAWAISRRDRGCRRMRAPESR